MMILPSSLVNEAIRKRREGKIMIEGRFYEMKLLASTLCSPYLI